MSVALSVTLVYVPNGSAAGVDPPTPWMEKAMSMDAIYVLTVVVFAFGSMAAALAWAEAQDRGPSK